MCLAVSRNSSAVNRQNGQAGWPFCQLADLVEPVPLRTHYCPESSLAAPQFAVILSSLLPHVEISQLSSCPQNLSSCGEESVAECGFGTVLRSLVRLSIGATVKRSSYPSSLTSTVDQGAQTVRQRHHPLPLRQNTLTNPCKQASGQEGKETGQGSRKSGE